MAIVGGKRLIFLSLRYHALVCGKSIHNMSWRRF